MVSLSFCGVFVEQFPLQSRVDSWQTQCELVSNNSTEINEYGDYLSMTFMEKYMKGKYAKQHGAFLDSWYAVPICD